MVLRHKNANIYTTPPSPELNITLPPRTPSWAKRLHALLNKLVSMIKIMLLVGPHTANSFGKVCLNGNISSLGKKRKFVLTHRLHMML